MKNARFIILSLMVLLCGTYADAQGVKVFKTDGTTIDVPYSEMDSIVAFPDKKLITEFVDMGLSVKWATCNVGAERPDEYGHYFAWGEISPKSSYSTDNCITLNKEMGDISGSYEFDAARANWGAPARMPTNEEINELCEKCSWRRIKYNGVGGMLVTGPNGNSIFLPAAGFYIESSVFGAGSDGYYSSSTAPQHTDEDVYYLDFDKKFYYWGSWIRRYLGQPVRPVSD